MAKGKSALSPDEKIINAHMDLFDSDMSDASNLMSVAKNSAETARKFAEELPSTRAEVDAVVRKVAEMATEFTAAEKIHREAKIAAAGGDKFTVELKVKEVSNRLQALKRLDAETKVSFEAAQKVAEKVRPFKEVVDEIKSIQKSLQDLLKEENEKVKEAQEEVNEVNRLSVVSLPGKAKVVAEKAGSLTPSSRDAKARLRQAQTATRSLKEQLSAVSSALNSANTAATRSDKIAADTALENAKVAKRRAEKATGASTNERGGEGRPTPQPSMATGGHQEEEPSVIEKLPMKLWGRLVVMGAMLFAILWFAPDQLKPFFGMVWIALLVFSLAPGVGKNPKWAKAFWTLAVVVALCIAFSDLMPWFTDGESIVEAIKGSVVDHTPSEDCRPGWFDDPCAD